MSTLVLPCIVRGRQTVRSRRQISSSDKKKKEKVRAERWNAEFAFECLIFDKSKLPFS